MPVLTFNAAAPLELQLTTFSCSVGATFWCLRSLGEDITQAALQEIMVPSMVSPDLGLLDSSGATIARLLRDRFGLTASNVNPVSFDDVAARAGKQPMLIGGRRWHVDPDSGQVTGHWVAVRNFDGQRIVLANPGGTGPRFGQQALDRDDFAARGSFSAVLIEVDGASPITIPAGKRFRIANTGGEGANVRAEPSTAATKVTAVREGDTVGGADHPWRHVTIPGGAEGWVANEFLLAGDGGQFTVFGTDQQGASLRREPDVSAERISVIAENTQVGGEERAWRKITTADGKSGWVAEEFLMEAQ